MEDIRSAQSVRMWCSARDLHRARHCHHSLSLVMVDQSFVAKTCWFNLKSRHFVSVDLRTREHGLSARLVYCNIPDIYYDGMKGLLVVAAWDSEISLANTFFGSTQRWSLTGPVHFGEQSWRTRAELLLLARNTVVLSGLALISRFATKLWLWKVSRPTMCSSWSALAYVMPSLYFSKSMLRSVRTH